MQISFVNTSGFEYITPNAQHPNFSMKNLEDNLYGTPAQIDCWVFDQ